MKILGFGIVKDIFDKPAIEMNFKDGGTVNHFKNMLEEKFPRLAQLGSYMIAVNNEYASMHDVVHEHDEVAIIPPVSGG